MAWSDYETAVVNAVVAASGLSDQLVRWQGSNTIRPEGLFLELAHVSLLPLGPDGTISDYDGGRPAGEEVRLQSTGPRQWTVQVAAYAAMLDPFAAQLGDGTPMDIATFTQLRLSLESVSNILEAQGSPLLRSGPVSSLPATIDNQTEMQAQFEMFFSICLTAEEFVGYINQVNALNEFNGQELVITGP